MDITNYNLQNCNPTQIININYPINDATTIQIYDDCKKAYDMITLQYAYSLDSVCWSCYMSYDELLKNTIDLNSDFYIRMKLNNIVGSITDEGEETTDYSSQLSSDFQLTGCDTQSSNLFSPYANLDQAVNLQTQLTETVSCLFGIPIYYFKLSPNAGSKDITFKEYALLGIEAVKQIKLLIADGVVPSSKPEFTDFGLEFQTDWETEISKVTFATAFGPTAQPIEGDLIYIPMMKRMWMVNAAYEEKNGSLMWNATTFKVYLVKYQEKGSVDISNSEDFIKSVVKNKYDDLFGDDNRGTFDSGEHTVDAPISATPNTLYAIYESDAQRKYMTCDSITYDDTSTYYKGTLISDCMYKFIRNDIESKVIYQQKYCGACASVSFIIKPDMSPEFENTILKVGNLEVRLKQSVQQSILYTNIYKDKTITLNNASTYFIVIRWDVNMRLFDFSAYLYDYNHSVPEYKLSSAHYKYDIDNPVGQYSLQYDIELESSDPQDINLYNFYGEICNIKVFSCYNDNISELLQMYPTHQHLMINDTCRRVLGNNGVILR